MKRLFVVLAVLFSCFQYAVSHDVEVKNDDGTSIWYNIYYELLTPKAVVTFKGNNYTSYKGEYSGEIVIPEYINYQGIKTEVVGIGLNAFRECYDLTSVSIPESVSYILDNAFWSCNSLYKCNLPEGLVSIGEHAYENCSNLETLVIPRNMSHIGKYAFEKCQNLSLIISKTADPDEMSGKNLFRNVDPNTPILVPKSSIDAYKNNKYWRQFSNIQSLFEIIASSEDPRFGTAIGGGDYYSSGDTAHITAVPVYGYKFVSWNDGNTERNRVVNVTGDASYRASFEIAACDKNISLSLSLPKSDTYYLTIYDTASSSMRRLSLGSVPSGPLSLRLYTALDYGNYSYVISNADNSVSLSGTIDIN